MDKVATIPKRWFESTVKTRRGDHIENLRVMYERMQEMGYKHLKLCCAQDYYFFAKRAVKEAGLNVPIEVYRSPHKRRKCTYKTIRRDCAKRNKYK